MIGEKEKQVIYMGSDHAGFKVKEGLRSHLEAEGYAVTDLGVFSEAPADYPDIAREVSEKVLEREGARGILICGTGIGVAMTANKYKGIRTVNAVSKDMAEMGRRHNNANILALGARLSNLDEMKEITDTFLHTNFEEKEDRHVRRVKKIDG
ncbi:ribose 5-phosphate isomerase B [Candidatus Peregrinibacteria bacterium]|nr:ribose 5-phosphate isomerase B [Candidatus Peregrinibacteria bacterium]